MTVARLRVAVEDALVAKQFGLAPENVLTGAEPFFLDGPVAERVAIVDRDPQTGKTNSVSWSEETRTYTSPDDLSTPEAIAVSVFGIVLETLALFEREDVLGHKVRWAFEGPQLLVVPRAGTWANAFYDRYSRSLQFFSFDAVAGIRVHTALSRDIVAHETGHAVLDGLAPPLYDALSPESLALHEAIGDLTAIMMALQSRQVRAWLVRDHGGDLVGSTPVSQLATQFGWAKGMNRPLRDANNSLTMDQIGQDPHDLCQVLTGAVWAAMAQLHQSAKEHATQSKNREGEMPIGKALGISSLRIARILFRALDYLPPAEATFADYAKAVLRSDFVAHPKDETGYRDALVSEFVRRGIVRSADELEYVPKKKTVQVDLGDVLQSDWAAYDFANRERSLLGIPPGIPFRLFPRRDVHRRYYLGSGQRPVRHEVVFQVTWEEQEKNDETPGLPSHRTVFHGTTLVLGDEPAGRRRHPVLSCLTTDGARRHVEARNRTVQQLFERDQLEVSDRWEAISRRPLAAKVLARVAGDTLRLRGTARLLHLGRQEP